MGRLLSVHGLTVELPSAAGWVRPVNDVSLEIDRGESVGLVGESGSGKTMLALALMGLLPPGARASGEALLERGQAQDGTDVPFRKGNARSLLHQSEEAWREVRGREMAMVFQEPMTALNPVMPIGTQIEEAIRAHEPALNASQARTRMLETLERAVVPEAEVRARQYAHQLSGGLRQRVMIAMALAGCPRLLIADEPTTALDVTVQKQILDLLNGLRRELKLALLFITHDLGVVAQVAERVAVMYAGRVVEQGPAREVLVDARHPYTQGLLAASPRLKRGRLTPIPGTVPQLSTLPPGCAFEPRCSLRQPQCSEAVPDLRVAGPNHTARCILV